MHKNEHRIFVSRKFKFQLAAKIRGRNACLLQIPAASIDETIAVAIFIFDRLELRPP
jgi:hypothetical protein